MCRPEESECEGGEKGRQPGWIFECNTLISTRAPSLRRELARQRQASTRRVNLATSSRVASAFSRSKLNVCYLIQLAIHAAHIRSHSPAVRVSRVRLVSTLRSLPRERPCALPPHRAVSCFPSITPLKHPTHKARHKHEHVRRVRKRPLRSARVLRLPSVSVAACWSNCLLRLFPSPR